HVGIPIGHVDQSIIQLIGRVYEFRELAARDKIMIVLVCFPQGIAHLQMLLIVVCPMFLRAIYRNAAIRAGMVDMSRLCGLSVLRVRAVCVALHVLSPITDSRRRGLIEGMEKVMLLNEWLRYFSLLLEESEERPSRS